MNITFADGLNHAFPTNSSLYIDSTSAWDYSGELNRSENDDTEDASGWLNSTAGADFVNPDNAYDETWNTLTEIYSEGAGGSASSKVAFIYENFTIPSFSNYATFNYKYRVDSDQACVSTFTLACYTGSSWETILYDSSDGSAVTTTDTIPSTCLTGATLQMRVQLLTQDITGSPNCDSGDYMNSEYYEGQVHWYNLQQTSNLCSYINTYLASCSYVSGYCYVPFLFHSDSSGYLEYLSMIFDSEGFHETANVFNNITIEGNVEPFILNVTSNSLLSARLVYNGTSYSGTIDSSDAPNYVVTRNLLIPQVNEDVNVTFYWDLTLTDGDYNSTFNNQTILNLSLDDCSSNTVTLFNFTLVDEEIKDLLNMSNPSLNGSIELDLDLSSFGYTTPFLEYSQTYTNGSFATICANINFTEATRYRTDLVGGFVTENHVQEFYHIDNGTINSTNIPQEITLYDLLLTDSTTFVFTFTDENNLIVEDAIVHVFRYYIGDGTFREVERAKEDDNGETLVHLVEEDVVYYFQVTLDGELLYTSSQYTAKCLETPCQITLTAGAVTDDFVPPDLLPEGTYSLSTDRETRLVTLAFNLNESATMNLSVFTLSGNQSRDDDVVNSSSLTAESGSFSVYVPETFGNITYYAVICHNGDIVTSQFIDLTPSARETFGVLGVFLSILLIILLGLIGATQGVWSVIFLVIGFILASMLTLLELDYLTLIFYVCLCLAIIYKLYTRKSAS
jgi:hypothetical protein